MTNNLCFCVCFWGWVRREYQQLTPKFARLNKFKNLWFRAFYICFYFAGLQKGSIYIRGSSLNGAFQTFAGAIAQTVPWARHFSWASSSNHCLAALDLGVGVEQPFHCLIVQNRQAVPSMRRSVDWTLEDNMVNGLFFCATLTGRRGGHTHLYKKERKRPTPVRWRLSRTQALLGRVSPGECRCRGWKCGILWDCLPTPHSIDDPPSAARMWLLSDEQMSCCAAGTNGCLNLRRRATALDGRESAEWSRYPGSMARRTRDSVAPLRRSSAGWMPARIGRLSTGLGRRHPVAIRKESLMAGRWGGYEQCGTRQVRSTLRLNAPGQEWLFAALLLQQPNRNQQARRVMSVSCEVTQGVVDTWATCPAL